MTPLAIRWSCLMLMVGLAACTGVDPTLGVAPAEPTAASRPDVALAPAPAPAAGGLAVHFAPVTGIAPAQAAELNAGINEGAANRGVAMLAKGDPAARFIVKGYLAALAEGNETSVIYVFDVLDNAGNRLHRIQGAEKSPGVSPDSWSAVKPETMRRIGERTLAELAAWAG